MKVESGQRERTRRGWAVPGIVLACCVLLFGCKSSEVSSPRISDATYFPLHVGLYWIYDVNETDILQTSCGDGGKTNLIYQIKVQVTDSTLNTDGVYAFILHRSKRTDATQPWTNLDTWTSYVSNGRIISNESNVLYVKLMYPFSASLKWNGNEYNDQAEDDYTLANIGQSYTLSSGTKFNKSVTVIQSDNQDLIVYQDKRSEVYAQNVGLVYKATTQLHYFTDNSCLGQQKVQQGLLYQQTLSEYGKQ